MFKESLPSVAALYSFVILLPTLIIAVITHMRLNIYCDKHKNTEDKSIIRKATFLRAIVLLLFSISGLFIGNVINLGSTFATAISQGMTSDPETGKYYITYGDMMKFNKRSIKETDIDVNDLKNKAVIYVRYDCPDCIILHDQLAEITDMIFLSSRSDLGKSARDMYDITLTEVPQGVFIDADGNSTVIDIMIKDEDGLKLDLRQIAILREMAARHEQLSTE